MQANKIESNNEAQCLEFRILRRQNKLEFIMLTVNLLTVVINSILIIGGTSPLQQTQHQQEEISKFRLFEEELSSYSYQKLYCIDFMKGEVGQQGPQGKQGPKGEIGQIGPIGPKGPIGEVGPIGPALKIDFYDIYSTKWKTFCTVARCEVPGLAQVVNVSRRSYIKAFSMGHGCVKDASKNGAIDLFIYLNGKLMIENQTNLTGIDVSFGTGVSHSTSNIGIFAFAIQHVNPGEYNISVQMATYYTNNIELNGGMLHIEVFPLE